MGIWCKKYPFFYRRKKIRFFRLPYYRGFEVKEPNFSASVICTNGDLRKKYRLFWLTPTPKAHPLGPTRWGTSPPGGHPPEASPPGAHPLGAQPPGGLSHAPLYLPLVSTSLGPTNPPLEPTNLGPSNNLGPTPAPISPRAHPLPPSWDSSLTETCVRVFFRGEDWILVTGKLR